MLNIFDYNTKDNLTSVCDYTGVNDDLSNNGLDANVNVQNDHDNVLCIDNNCSYNAANLHQLVSQSHNSVDKVSSIQGESYSTQVIIQHNRGGGTVHNVHIEPAKQHGSYEHKQSLCNSNWFTLSAVDHHLSTYPPIHHNANLEYTNW